MIKIAALLGDYWHDPQDAKAGLKAALSRLPYKAEIDVHYITHPEVSDALDEKPTLLINAKMNRLNPKDEHVITWLTDELDEKIVNYVESGGNLLTWHAGMASYPSESKYIQMLRGYFDYHPPGLQEVTYRYKDKENTKEQTFLLSDEQYSVICDQAKTEVDLWSTGVAGDTIAGWKHFFGNGKVCCFTPAHTKEGMLNENVSTLLAEKINWLITR
ncbi:ThuA domain-containing protein [Metabacillus sp. Hm71]|uniref:ThuA domain-containing protein n=1 Tax=Metabacillus sp. Hm71 TaxID=3450743 RepID=UPI003F43F757